MNGSEGDNSREDTLAELLRKVGSRQSPPAPVADAVRASVHEVWIGEVRRRRQRRRMAMGLVASLVLAVAATLVVMPRTLAPVEFAAVDHVVDDVAYRSPGAAWRPLAEGVNLPAGTLRTGDASLVALRTTDGFGIRVAPQSVVELTAGDELFLRQGRIYVDAAEPEGKSMLVSTAHGTVRDIGTRFEVRSDDDGWHVTVRDGLVEMLHDSQTYRAEGGERVSIGQDNDVVRALVPAWDASWQWVQSATEPLDIDGKSLAAYLAWVGHETGMRVEFESGSVEQDVERTILHGSIRGLTPRESLAAVLSTTDFRLVAEREDALTIGR